MADILRATRASPASTPRRRWCWSKPPRLRQMQAATLAALRPVWLDRVEDLPEGPLFLIANEFLDALPIRQFQRGRRAGRNA
jgi:NADH dehydrogenase [ubiquinone] 1 alpha subcomplex assembly factor 7